ncbi:MAG TPA: hypothetical protein VMZ53_03640 [Kofleriaceae bacterium]|nr:hypothetical protein [Kofleriaceae bacterium]
MAFGDTRGPVTEVPSYVVKAAGGMGSPSKAHRPVARVERRGAFVRVRVWFASEGAAVWFSPGYCTLSLPRFALLKARSWWRRWREPVPRAHVVQR